MVLQARTNAEAHLYMDLHPCECGEVAFERDNRVVAADGDLVSVYEGACAGCGAVRRFEFAVPELPLPPTQPMSYGGAAASPIIDPGQFMTVADSLAKSVPGSPAGLDPAARKAARLRLETAMAAVAEVLKFIPDGRDRVPESAFTSDAGKAALAAEPGRFRKRRLEAVLGAYRDLAARLATG